ncbi:RS24B [Hepatospora eriocheir]|uniref:RS24B n=1 Tax=Hepatospora eriocheir TaxID=1081669 RepID=A0A1X0QDV0_9MICR|nr:RS24B [Hepatospora eriocheir]
MSVHLKITKSFTNQVLNRKELCMEITHSNQATPNKAVIVDELSVNYSIPKNQIYVFKMKTEFGIQRSKALAHLYNSEESLREIEKQYVIKRTFNEEIDKLPRRSRKENRKKAAKRFGTEQRLIKKVERRQKD